MNSRSTKKHAKQDALTLSIDVGASHVKAHLLDERGHPLMDRVRIDTPDKLTPVALVRLLADLAGGLPHFDRVSVGLPGIVHRGRVYSIPLFGDHRFRRFPLADRLSERLDRPVRLMNDGEMHGLGVIHRHGLELVLTLGTGLGTALYLDGDLGPRIQFVSAPRKSEPPGGAFGDAARKKIGNKRWSHRVLDLIENLRRVTNFERCYLGGGNADRIKGRLSRGVTRIDNSAAALGGVRLWQWDIDI